MILLERVNMLVKVWRASKNRGVIMPRSNNPYAQRGFLKSPPSLSGIGGFSDAQRVRDDADAAKRDEEMIQRVVFGEAGDRGTGDFKSRLDEELQNPALPMTEAETRFREDPFAVDRLRQKLKLESKPARGRVGSSGTGTTPEERIRRNAELMARTLLQTEMGGDIGTISKMKYLKNPKLQQQRYQELYEQSLRRLQPEGMNLSVPEIPEEETPLSRIRPASPRQVIHSEHGAAMEWADAHPDDPRAEAIRRKASQFLRK
jgi:hypothetical protein